MKFLKAPAWAVIALPICISLTLTACGGGGGGGGGGGTISLNGNNPPDNNGPTGPREVVRMAVHATFNTPKSATGILKDGNIIYVADRSNAVLVLQVANGSELNQIGSVELGEDIKAYSLAKSGNSLYVAGREGGLAVVDVTDPANPIAGLTYDTPDVAMYATLQGDRLFLSDRKGLLGFDISDRMQPYQTWALAADNMSFLRSTAQGNQLVLAGYAEGVTAFSFPAGEPVLDSSEKIGRPAWSIAQYPAQSPTEQNYYLLGGEGAGFTVFDLEAGAKVGKTLPLTDVAQPKAADETGYDIVTRGHFAFVADGKNGIQVVSVEDVNTPYIAGSLKIKGDIRDLSVDGDLLVAADADTGVHLLSIEVLPDTDGDGFANSLDDFPSDPDEWLDTDGDGEGNNTDTDDDNDGIADADDPHSGLYYEWDLEPIADGFFDVSVRWDNSPQRDSKALYTVVHSRGSDVIEVDQPVVGGTWVSLGRYLLQDGKAPKVILQSADSIQADEGEVAIDFDGEIRSGWAIQNISNTSVGTEAGVSIEGDKIVWVRNGANIQMFDTKTFEVTTISTTGKEAGSKFAPNIQSGQVVWRTWDGDREQSIYLWDGEQVNLIDSYTNEGQPYIINQGGGFPPTNHSLDPSIWEGRVTYSKWDGSDYEVYVWENGTVTQITDDDDEINDLEPNIGGDYIGFTQWPFVLKSEPHYLSLWDAKTNTIIQLAENGDDAHTDGVSVVFSDWNDDIFGRGFDVIRWKDGVYETISDTFGNDFEAQVSGDLISWASDPREGFTEGDSRDVYIYDNGTVLALADSDLTEQITWAEGNTVAFGRSDGTQYDVFMATRVPDSE